MNTHEHAGELGVGAIKILPPAYVAGTSALGLIEWQLWVYVLTALFLAMQIVQFIWEKWIKPWRKRAKRSD
jgi:hypothetical protein